MTETIEREVQQLYARRARWYDLTANLYYLMGLREERYRAELAGRLGLSHGDTVVEIGCGTGLNFRHLQRAVGRTGRIVGVDLTADMLAQAERRVRAAGWTNVELVHADAAEWTFPRANGVCSMLALSLSPRCDEILEHAAAALLPGGRVVILDLKLPPPPLSRALPAILPLVRPFGVTERHVRERPWEAIWGTLYRSLEDVHVDERYGGLLYFASGRAPRRGRTLGGGVTDGTTP